MSRSIQRRRFNSAQSRQEARRRAVRAAVGCAVESLEERRLFSTLTVNTVADGNAADNVLNLHEAIELIEYNGDPGEALGRSLDDGELAQIDTSTDPFGTNDTIVFDNLIAGQTITFGSEITISGTMVIDGGSAGMTLSGSSSRAFYVTSTGDLTLNHLILTNFSDVGADGSASAGGEGKGGAIYVDQGTLTITNSTLSNNSAIGGDGDSAIGGMGLGGAIYIDHGSVTITSSTLSNNSATGGDATGAPGGSGRGGAVYNGEGTLTVIDSTLANNSAAGGSGSSGNNFGWGGAIWVTDGDSTLSFSTVSSNTAADGGRGLYVSSSGAAVVEIDNSILGQSDNSVTDLVFFGTVTASGSNNLIRNTAVTAVTSLSSADPKLGTLQDNGGPTATMRPAADSPAIDAADDSGGTVTTDQRGVPRPAGAADIGAAESRFVLTVSSTADTDTRDSDLTLREAVEVANGTLAYADLTPDEQARVGGTTGDPCSVVFAPSIASQTINFASQIMVTKKMLIDGGASGMTLSGSNSRAFSVQTTGKLTLNHLTITNFSYQGYDGGGEGDGGAIYVSGYGTLTLTNCTLSNNSAAGGAGTSGPGGASRGGAIYATGSGAITLTDTTLSDNSATGGDGGVNAGGSGYGGAIYAAAGALTITNCTLSNNSAVGGSGGGGAGGRAEGGAIYATSCTGTITGSTLANNAATGGSGDSSGNLGQGGAVYNTSATFTITGCTLANNSAAGGSGDSSGGPGQGGAVYQNLGTLTITNSTLANNSAAGGSGTSGGVGQGGAIYFTHGHTTLSSSTLSSNTAPQGGLGLYVLPSGFTTVIEIDNSILGQSDNSVADVVFDGTVTASGSNNLIRNTSVTGIGIVSSADPKLGPLQDNGGPTQTMLPAVDSPAIDAADDTLGGAPSTDQRGIARPAGAYDIGAAELRLLTLTVSTTDDTDSRDSDLTLREAVEVANGTLTYADLTAGEQAWLSAPLGDAYAVVFAPSIAGQTITLGSAVGITGTMTIDGGASGMTLSGGVSQATWRAFYINSNAELTLNNLTITNFGQRAASGNSSPGFDGMGGAIYVDHSTLTLTNSTLSNNAVTGGLGDGAAGGMGLGGAIYINHGSVTITGSTLNQNSATGNQEMNYSGAGGAAMGGAIYNTGGTLTVTDSTLSNNSATGGDAYNLGSGGDADGGAVYVDSAGTVTVTDSTLSNNSATGGEGNGGAHGGNAGGGALYVDQTGTLTVTGAITLLSNTATGGDGSWQGGNAAGGAIANHWGAFTLAITGGTVEQNAAVGGYSGPSDGWGQGGAIYSANGTASLTFTNSTLSNNSATADANGIGEGGALFVDSNTLTVTNSTLAGNSAVGGSGGQGGAIYVNFGDTTLSFSTLSANTAAGGGRGLYAWSGNTLEIDNSILGQSDNSVTDLDGSALSVSGSNNLIRNTTFVSGINTGAIGIVSNADPKLGPLHDNGGPTQTMRPAPDSPAIDAADDSGAPSTDQRGIARPAGAYDIGALEYTQLTLTVSSTADTDARDSDLTLREAIELANGTLSYADLTAGEQAWFSVPVGDVYDVVFDGSIAGQTITLGSQINVSGTVMVDGGTAGMTLSGSNSRAFYVTSTGDLTLNKLTVDSFGFVGTLGSSTPGGDARGGAIYLDHGALTITNSTLSNNHVQGGYGLSAVGGNANGGAIYVDHGSVTITGSTLSGNIATGGYGDVGRSNGLGSGGAIGADHGSLTITDSTLSNNTATGVGGAGNAANGSGGAVYNYYGTLTVTGATTLQNNTASGNNVNGGAISNNLGTFTLNITGGTVTQNTATGTTASGGAIYTVLGTASLTFTNSTLSDNSAAGNGSGGFAYLSVGAALSLTDCTVDHNTADGYGGAIMLLSGSTLSVTGGTASYNSAAGSSLSEGRGGFLYNTNGTVTLTNASLSYNSATTGSNTGNALGGAIYSMGVSASVTIVGGMLDHNSAVAGAASDAGAAMGGAIYVFGSSLTITGAALIDNSAVGSDSSTGNANAANGGAIGGLSAIVTITDSTLVGNAATGGNSTFANANGGDGLGGAIYDDSGSVTITNTTLANNSAVGGTGDTAGAGSDGSGRGGAIYANDSDTTLNFSTLSANTAAQGGRGLYFLTTGTNLQIDNSILGQADNSVTDLEVSGSGYTESGSNNLIRNTAETGISNLSSADPRLASLGDYGGGAQTFALLPDSPALDAAGASGAVTLDVRGAARDYNGTSDVGSFESQGYTLTLDSGSTPQSADAGQTFDNPLAVTLTENGFDAPIPGATITFTAPSPGSASATVAATATTDSGGDATVTPTANNHVGSYTVTASLGGPQDETGDFALTNTAVAPSITSANHATFTAGSAGTFTIVTTGTPDAVLSKTGTLPSGITFTDNGDGTATLSGTPSASGTFTLTITAANGATPDATQTFTLSVTAAAVTGTAPTITSPDHLTLLAGQAGSFTVTTTGSPIAALHVTGTLPDGVTFVDNGDGTGTFSGATAATLTGAYALSVVADNGVGQPATQAFTITVAGVHPVIVTSGDSRGSIQVNNPDGTNRFTITSPFQHSGARLASGDVTGDGVPDVIAAAGPGSRARVVVYDGLTGSRLNGFRAFAKTFTGGIFVTTGDVDGDGTPDIIASQGRGGASRTRVFSGADGSVLTTFQVPGTNAVAGTSVASADLNGDGFDDVITASGSADRYATVRVLDGRALSHNKVKYLTTLSPDLLGFTGGAFVTTGDVDGDGTPDVIVSQATGTSPVIGVFNGKRIANSNLKAARITSFRTPSTDGARVASHDVNADGRDDIIASVTVNGSAKVKFFNGSDGSLIDTLTSDHSGGVFVA